MSPLLPGLLGLTFLFSPRSLFPNTLVSCFSFSSSPMIAQSSTIPTFEAAIEQTKTLLVDVSTQKISNAEFAQQVQNLVQSQNGARGFFVVYLTADLAIADQPSPGLLSALESSPEIVGELLVKNLAMSSATEVLHRRNQDQALALGSATVRQRTIALIEKTNLPPVPRKLTALQTTLKTGEGEYQAFIERWDYDGEQKQAILAAIASVNFQQK